MATSEATIEDVRSAVQQVHGPDVAAQLDAATLATLLKERFTSPESFELATYESLRDAKVPVGVAIILQARPPQPSVTTPQRPAGAAVSLPLATSLLWHAFSVCRRRSICKLNVRGIEDLVPLHSCFDYFSIVATPTCVSFGARNAV